MEPLIVLCLRRELVTGVFIVTKTSSSRLVGSRCHAWRPECPPHIGAAGAGSCMRGIFTYVCLKHVPGHPVGPGSPRLLRKRFRAASRMILHWCHKLL
jgi:hypothetical protein